MNYLSSAEILYVHSRVVSEIGGRDGVADAKTLKRAVNYIKNNEVFPSVFDKAGALIFAIAKKRPFSSSNLRTAIAAAGTFLRINRKEMDLSRPTFLRFVEDDLARASVSDISKWLSNNCS